MIIFASQPAPRVRSLEEAQGRINDLTRQLQERDRQIETLNQRIAALEERLHVNSRNSSTPPSADPHRAAPTKRPSGKKRGAQPGHSGKARTLLPPDQVTETHDCRPGPCPVCRGAVKIAGLITRHQLIDLPPITPVVTEYRLFAGACHACGRVCEAALPPGVSHRVTDPRLLAVIGALSGVYHLS